MHIFTGGILFTVTQNQSVQLPWIQLTYLRFIVRINI